MKKYGIIIFIWIAAGSCTQGVQDHFVFVKGGNFFIGRYEVTQKEWTNVMGNNPSHFRGESLPVEMVSWYDCVDFCDRRSIREGLKPYYVIDSIHRDTANRNELDSVKWTVRIDSSANGYRLPTEAEWEFAAKGGQLSKGYRYSGSNDVEEVAWYWKNAGDQYLSGNWSWSLVESNHDRTKPVGTRAPNELGLYDMSGNVREWCWDEDPGKGSEPQGRIWKGGGWMGAEFCCEPGFRAGHEANGKGPDQGFRLCRNGGK